MRADPAFLLTVRHFTGLIDLWPLQLTIILPGKRSISQAKRKSSGVLQRIFGSEPVIWTVSADMSPGYLRSLLNVSSEDIRGQIRQPLLSMLTGHSSKDAKRSDELLRSVLPQTECYVAPKPAHFWKRVEDIGEVTPGLLDFLQRSFLHATELVEESRDRTSIGSDVVS
jgi:hypothetical protein